MSREATKPCTKCGCNDPRELKKARSSRWWCTGCIREANQQYWRENKERILSERRARKRRRKQEIIEVEPDREPRSFRLVDDPTGQYRPRITEFTKGDLYRLVEDAYAPTGSVWRGDNGEEYEVEGDQLESQKLVPVQS